MKVLLSCLLAIFLLPIHLNAMNEIDKNLLQAATAGNLDSIVEIFGSNTQIQMETVTTAFLLSIQDGHLNCVKYFVIQRGMPISSIALDVAATYNHYEICKFFLNGKEWKYKELSNAGKATSDISVRGLFIEKIKQHPWMKATDWPLVDRQMVSIFLATPTEYEQRDGFCCTIL